MKFINAQCKLCGWVVFQPELIRAMEDTGQVLRVVELQEQPHAGMRCVCTACISMLQGVLD